MSKNYKGRCSLCGKRKKLTFEHVPPEKAFNNTPVKICQFQDMLKVYTGSDGRMPWDFTGIRGKNSQRGNGDFVLCAECNNNTGSWYISEYVRFAKTMHAVLCDTCPNIGNRLAISINGVYPQRIFKAILTMFCDVNKGCFGDKKLRKYILNSESTKIDLSKYSVYMYLVDDNMRRIQGLSMVGRTGGGMVAVSEIANYPIGLLLYIDLPDGYNPPGVCINDFAKYSYDDMCNINLVGVPYFSINTLFPEDFRTKEEIIAQRQSD